MFLDDLWWNLASEIESISKRRIEVKPTMVLKAEQIFRDALKNCKLDIFTDEEV